MQYFGISYGRGQALCVSCAEQDIKAGRRPAFSADPAAQFMAEWVAQDRNCDRCKQPLIRNGGRMIEA